MDSISDHLNHKTSDLNGINLIQSNRFNRNSFS